MQRRVLIATMSLVVLAGAYAFYIAQPASWEKVTNTDGLPAGPKDRVFEKAEVPGPSKPRSQVQAEQAPELVNPMDTEAFKHYRSQLHVDEQLAHFQASAEGLIAAAISQLSDVNRDRLLETGLGFDQEAFLKTLADQVSQRFDTNAIEELAAIHDDAVVSKVSALESRLMSAEGEKELWDFAQQMQAKGHLNRGLQQIEKLDQAIGASDQAISSFAAMAEAIYTAMPEKSALTAEFVKQFQKSQEPQIRQSTRLALLYMTKDLSPDELEHYQALMNDPLIKEEQEIVIAAMLASMADLHTAVGQLASNKKGS